jgi:hypothetical protein
MNATLDSLVWITQQYSRENPIRGKALTLALGLRSVRELQELVQEARGVHRLEIGANSGGYFFCRTEDEVREMREKLLKRGRETMRASRAFRPKHREQECLID